MLGVKKPLAWRIADNSLVIEIPEQLQDEANRPCKQAWAFRIEGCYRGTAVEGAKALEA